MSDEVLSLPLFPLSNVVLFPRVRTPLHLFEPRYRQLAEDVLAGERKIGMVMVRPGHLAAMGGDPPLYPIGCCGSVREFQKLPDGRYNLVLIGEYRFRILAEAERSPERLYRLARVVRLEDAYADAEQERVARLRTNIIENVSSLVGITEPERAASFRSELFTGVDDATFVNSLSNAFALPAEDKQSLLEADSIPDRFARLAGVLSFRLAELDASEGSHSQQLH